MPATLHNSLILLATQVLRSLPAPVHGALDAWSLRRARRRALKRQQQQWQKRKAVPATPGATAAYHLKPWRD